MNPLFETASGFWNPVFLFVALSLALIIAIAIRSRGNKTAKKTGGQGLAFFSGNVEPEQNIAAGNLYWGFFESMKPYYDVVKKMHNGIVNDYVFWFVLLLIVLIVTFVFGGMAWV